MMKMALKAQRQSLTRIVTMVLQLYFLVPALTWSLSTGKFTIGTTTLFLTVLSTVAWCLNAALDYAFIIGRAPHDAAIRQTAEGVLVMVAILFSVMSLLNIVLFW
jgi:hypothetical protein